MSIIGNGSEWYVGKEKSTLITWNGKRKPMDYRQLSKIEYCFASPTSDGIVSFVKKTDEKMVFKFKSKSNDPVLRAIDLIKENNTELDIIKIDRPIYTEKNEPIKKSSILQSLFFFIIAIMAIYFIVQVVKVPVTDEKVSHSVADPYISESTDDSLSTESKEIDTFNVGDVFDSDTLKIMYIDCGEYETNNEFMKPESGNKFIYVDFSIHNTGDSDYSIGSLSFDCYADDTECTFAITDIESAMTSITTLSPGRNVAGRICYEVPADATSIEIEFETSFWTEDKIYFIVN